MSYGSNEDLGPNHRTYRSRIGKVGLDGFAADVIFTAFTPMGGSTPNEATTDAAFQDFVDFIDNSTEFEFRDDASDTFPPQKWSTIKNEVTPDP